MANEEKKIPDIHEILANALRSDDQDLINHSLDVIREKGSDQIIPDLVSLLRNNSDPFLKRKVMDILADIKTPRASEFILEQIKDPKNQSIRSNLLAVCWESGLDMKPHLEFFVNLAINGDFYVSIEVNTIIGEMEPPVDKEQRKNALLNLKKALRKELGEKQGILESISGMIKELK